MRHRFEFLDLRRTKPRLWTGPLLLLLGAAFCLAASACGAGGGAGGVASPAETGGGYRGTVLQSALPKPQFTLTNTSADPYEFATETEGYVTLVYFGYTYCPDICPDHMANIASVLERLPGDVAERVKVVFVTVDPERDTPERLRQWLDLFDPSFVGLTGSAESIDSAMKQALGELYFPITREDLGQGEYSVGHAAFVLAYTPDNQAHTVYPFGIRQEDWEHDLVKLVKVGWTEPPPMALEPTATAVTIFTAAPSRPPGAPGAPDQGPKRVSPGEARKLLGNEFTATTVDAVKESIEAAFQKHPDAVRLTSQGLMVPRENLDLEVRICGSSPQSTTDSSLLACSTLGGCARLTRILYDYYMQSGYEEFYQAAVNVFNYVSTALPNEADAFFLIVRSELRVSGLPTS